MDTLGFEPRAFRMGSGCDTTTPCAELMMKIHNTNCTRHGVGKEGVLMSVLK